MTASPYNLAVWVSPSSVANAPIAYIIGGLEYAKEVVAAWDSTRATLAFIGCPDWNRDLSPWPAPACFRGGEAFAGEADRFLNRLLTETIRRVEWNIPLPISQIGNPNPPVFASRALIGVSLAGLFSLYALYRTDLFSMCASISGSLWFDGFLDFIKSQTLPARPEKIYLSLGDREELTKNPRLRPVGEATRAANAHFASLGIETCLKMNPGNHFADPVPRLIRALDWLYR